MREAAGEEHILRLEIAIGDASRVEVLQRGDDARRVEPHVRLCERANLLEQMKELATE